MQSGSVLAGRYRLTRPLASGSMGQVWVAYDETLGREVAVKVQSLTGGEDSPAVQRFRREPAAEGRHRSGAVGREAGRRPG
ncbi:MAG TPA: hypothetical protein VK045_04265 [Ornithinicoccus sp.]|nr:hypothetical protein [Ornithinicoccus sp.]